MTDDGDVPRLINPLLLGLAHLERARAGGEAEHLLIGEAAPEPFLEGGHELRVRGAYRHLVLENKSRGS